MKLYCVQLDSGWENKAASFARVEALLSATVPERGSLVLLPEMFATGFSMNAQNIAEYPDGETEKYFANLAREFSIFILGGVVTPSSDGRGYNEAVVVSPDGISVARYRKIHPFSLGGENKYYAAGQSISLFEWHGFRVAPFICYDLRFPEIFRAAVKKGANLFVVIANWPAAREGHWTALLKARAIENQAYILGVNRCGDDPKLHYSGHSQIIDPHGEIIADGGENEGVICAKLDLSALDKYRHDFPALADMKF